MDPLSLVLASITFVQSISSTYNIIRQLKGLPKAFQNVYDDLPLVLDTLESARDELQRREPLTEDVKKSVDTVTKRCHDNAQKLKTIFDKVKEKQQQESKDGKDWSVVEFYRDTLRSFGRLAKAHKVESLMKELLQELQKMAVTQVFKTATAAQVAKVEDAIKALATVEPSVPDSDLEESGPFHVEQNIESGGKGNQAINRGGHQENTFGHRFETGGGNMTFVFYEESETRCYSNLPSSQVSAFIGRRPLLDEIDHYFHPELRNPQYPVIVVLWGMGGRGKSTIAVQYGHLKETGGYRGLFWINALSEESTIRSFQEVADTMNKTASRHKPLLKPLTWDTVSSELSAWKLPWLLIFDNHDDPNNFQDLAKFFPRGGSGSILVTTRQAKLGQTCGWKRIEIPDMSEAEALELLEQTSGQSILTDGDKAAGKQIVKMLGYLPMAITATGSHIFRLRRKLEDYILGFDKFKKYIIENIPVEYRHDEKQRNWYTTYEYSIETLPNDVKRIAVPFLSLSAFFGEAFIQEDLLRESYRAKELEPCLSWLSSFTTSTGWDGTKFREFVIALDNRGLVQFREASSKTTETHKLVPAHPDGQSSHGQSSRFQKNAMEASATAQYFLHPVIRDWLRCRPLPPPGNQAAVALAVITNYLERTDLATMSLQSRLIVLTHLESFVRDEATLTLMNNGYGLNSPDDYVPPAFLFAVFCRKFSRLKRAKELLEDLLRRRKEAGISEDNPKTVDITLELAQTFLDNAEVSVAEAHFTSVLQLSPNLSSISEFKAALGQAESLGAQHKYRAARPAAERALKLSENGSIGDKFLVLAKISLARIEGSRGHRSRVNTLVNEVFEMTKNFDPKDEAVTEATMLKVDQLLSEGQVPEGKALLLDTIQAIEEQNGEDHRMALNAYLRMGLVYGRSNQHDDARKYFMKAKSHAGVLFGDTPGDVDIEVLIGYTYLNEKRYDEARNRFDEAFERSKAKAGFEMCYVRANIARLEWALAKGDLLHAIPLCWVFFQYFPFAAFLRSYKTSVLCATAVVILLLHHIIQGHLLITIVICGVIAAVGPLVLR